mmetsp:Transcript_66941/g.178007  ORF Transcript_66941/g.178007 Transcript_66941/m.178007 type:complete len:210 (-) Transcript_66941:359-988(-)
MATAAPAWRLDWKTSPSSSRIRQSSQTASPSPVSAGAGATAPGAAVSPRASASPARTSSRANPMQASSWPRLACIGPPRTRSSGCSRPMEPSAGSLPTSSSRPLRGTPWEDEAGGPGSERRLRTWCQLAPRCLQTVKWAKCSTKSANDMKKELGLQPRLAACLRSSGVQSGEWSDHAPSHLRRVLGFRICSSRARGPSAVPRSQTSSSA